ncbi:alpha-ketoglutarate-dependent dioxygenase AlkB family protein [Paraglaciecola polaris]|uniref:Alpha-ketoglutarate-dependent dioxygenase alkB homolog 3 n=1 Tax=Paraglaciecola polaris LMG 21857 TaxID=1129793 RepID=K6ZQD5_9ALTE|nr:alpha-ketoglutarate-dependent dioxygenase AlkB [Paraglaciecola polaris]GAC32492.1 alpha-ketoglutarate-dependent dioxygenase alkB homolog 3 [Paraglaciecola polaris LMG 21857]
MQQSSLFPSAVSTEPEILPLPGGDFRYFRHFLSSQEADYYSARLLTSLAWRQDHIKMYGKQVKIPRLQAWYGDADALYQYSGLNLQPYPWSEELAELRVRCETVSKTRFNSVLANCYRDGQDSMAWHSDDEPELGRYPLIASLSLGQVRNFDLKHRVSGERHRLPLEHGSLLIMAGRSQEFWLHSLAKTKKSLAQRINLTFRLVSPNPQG